jgi:NADH-quinone oxidoreductase subunit F
VEKILLKNFGVDKSRQVATYEAGGGYRALKKALGMKPAEIIDEVKKSGLRGRGGAGFPAGMKWSFIPKDSSLPKYLVCNADESEPGTFKDRVLMEHDPHLVIEGLAISAYAIGCHLAFIYIRGEFFGPEKCMNEAIAEAYSKGYLGKNILGSGFDLDLHVHKGAGAYICGEETGLLESIEGKRGYPRLKPPFPALVGLFKSPTVINNVETLASVPYIIENGAGAYRKFGTEKSPGTKLFCVSGSVNKPGVYELPLGYPFPKLIHEVCGGIRGGRALKAVIPGGSSTPVLRAEEIGNLTLDYESIASAGSMLGSGGVIVIDDSTCMVRTLRVMTDFYAHESCGQCTPCREGTLWMAKILRRLEAGKGVEGDVDLLGEIASNIMGRTVCPLGDAAAMPVISFLKKFREEFDDHAMSGKCAV